MKTRIWTRKKKTKTGSSRVLAVVVGLLAICGVSEGRNERERRPAPEAVIAGTVFRPPGFALPGAEVRVRPALKESQRQKLKEIQVVTNTRGEFAVRVPAVPAEWTVNVQSSGYMSSTKTVTIEGEQRLDLSFLLDTAGKPKGESK